MIIVCPCVCAPGGVFTKTVRRVLVLCCVNCYSWHLLKTHAWATVYRRSSWTPQTWPWWSYCLVSVCTPCRASGNKNKLIIESDASVGVFDTLAVHHLRQIVSPHTHTHTHITSTKTPSRAWRDVSLYDFLVACVDMKNVAFGEQYLRTCFSIIVLQTL